MPLIAKVLENFKIIFFLNLLFKKINFIFLKLNINFPREIEFKFREHFLKICVIFRKSQLSIHKIQIHIPFYGIKKFLRILDKKS